VGLNWAGLAFWRKMPSVPHVYTAPAGERVRVSPVAQSMVQFLFGARLLQRDVSRPGLVAPLMFGHAHDGSCGGHRANVSGQ
jgi:hypothetical protein